MEAIKQLFNLIKKTDKIYLLPIILILIILALIIVTASVSPVPIFIYPFV